MHLHETAAELVLEVDVPPEVDLTRLSAAVIEGTLDDSRCRASAASRASHATDRRIRLAGGVPRTPWISRSARFVRRLRARYARVFVRFPHTAMSHQRADRLRELS